MRANLTKLKKFSVNSNDFTGDFPWTGICAATEIKEVILGEIKQVNPEELKQVKPETAKVVNPKEIMRVIPNKMLLLPLVLPRCRLPVTSADLDSISMKRMGKGPEARRR